MKKSILNSEPYSKKLTL